MNSSVEVADERNLSFAALATIAQFDRIQLEIQNLRENK